MSPRSSVCLQQQQRGSRCSHVGLSAREKSEGLLRAPKMLLPLLQLSSHPSCCGCWGPLRRGRAASPVPRELTLNTALGKRRGEVAGQTRPSTGAVPSLGTSSTTWACKVSSRRAGKPGGMGTGMRMGTRLTPPRNLLCQGAGMWPMPPSLAFLPSPSLPAHPPQARFFWKLFWHRLNHPQN